MDLLRNLETSLRHLLETQECVVLPGVGAFLSRDTASAVNRFSMEVKPAARTLFFNASIVEDDGHLKGYLSQTLQIPYHEATHQVNEMVKLVLNQLANHRKLALGSLGNFFKNQDDKIFFMPSPQLNMAKDSFGLPSLPLFTEQANAKAHTVTQHIDIANARNGAPQPGNQPIKQPSAVPAVEEEARVVGIDDEIKKSPKRFGKIWKAAAAVAFVSLTGAAIAVLYPILTKNNTQQAAIQKPLPIDSPVKQEPVQPEAKEVLPLDTVSNNSLPEVVTIKKEEAKNHELKQEESAKSMVTANFLEEIQQKPGNWYVVGGAYLSEKLANMEVQGWKTKGINACLIQTKGSSLLRVILGRYTLETDAVIFGNQLPEYHGRKPTVKQLK